MIDTDNSGHITFEELKAGISRIGSNLKESEIYDLMQAVCIIVDAVCNALRYLLLFDTQFYYAKFFKCSVKNASNSSCGRTFRSSTC